MGAYKIDANKIRQAAKFRGMTLNTLSIRAKISWNTLNSILNGKVKRPHLSTLGSLAIALQVSWQMLIEEEN
ncbi:MAG: helix-turn-helix transcriptional regulator [Selenomonadaceae bacterium]|nr:helix-turn-helix transcriptional regulator [Selenomonadaceae bacterium]